MSDDLRRNLRARGYELVDRLEEPAMTRDEPPRYPAGSEYEGTLDPDPLYVEPYNQPYDPPDAPIVDDRPGPAIVLVIVVSLLVCGVVAWLVLR